MGFLTQKLWNNWTPTMVVVAVMAFLCLIAPVVGLATPAFTFVMGMLTMFSAMFHGGNYLPARVAAKRFVSAAVAAVITVLSMVMLAAGLGASGLTVGGSIFLMVLLLMSISN